MTHVPEEVKKQLLDYPFSTLLTTPQASKMRVETAKNTDTSINGGVRA